MITRWQSRAISTILMYSFYLYLISGVELKSVSAANISKEFCDELLSNLNRQNNVTERFHKESDKK